MVSIAHLPYLCLALRPHLGVAPVLYFGNCNIAPQADPPFLHSLLLCPRRNSLCEKCPENRHWHCSKSRPNLMNRRWERWKRTVSVKKDVHELPVQWAHRSEGDLKLAAAVCQTNTSNTDTGQPNFWWNSTSQRKRIVTYDSKYDLERKKIVLQYQKHNP